MRWSSEIDGISTTRPTPALIGNCHQAVSYFGTGGWTGSPALLSQNMGYCSQPQSILATNPYAYPDQP